VLLAARRVSAHRNWTAEMFGSLGEQSSVSTVTKSGSRLD
jgi:hypothetical protein